MGWYYDYNAKPTVETDEGIKARSKRGAFVKNWWATRWIEAMEDVMDRGRLSRGRRYARKGQVLSVTEKPGKVVGKVQGSRSRPYTVTIRISALSKSQWQSVTDALVARPIFMAQLLAGEMPQDIEDAFADAGLSLFPSSAEELSQDCSCPDWAPVCKHMAATHYILAERFDENPFLLFLLRGQSQDDLIKALERKQGSGMLREESPPEYVAAPLPSSVSEFWGVGSESDRFPAQIEPPPIRYPALVRMGAPAFMEDIEQKLGPAYDSISEAAIASVYDDTISENEDASE